MLDLSTFLIRERIGVLKVSNTYDILDPRTGGQVGIAKEDVSGLVMVLRMFVNKRMLPTVVNVYRGDSHEDLSKLVFSLRRGMSLFKPQIEIYDANGTCVGSLVVKVMTIGRTFTIHDPSGAQIGMVKGNFVGWDFRILDLQERELGRINKTWSGMGRELFTSADNYVIHLGTNPGPGKALLFLAAGLAIDTVFKEK